MHLYGKRVFEGQGDNRRGPAANYLRAVAAALLTLAAGVPSGFAQQAAVTAPQDKNASNLPAEPTPISTEPLWMRPSTRDFTKPAGRLLGNPINMYRPTTIANADFNNPQQLTDLVKDGKIYLSLSEAIALALQNNYDIAISRYYFDIADLDVLRSKAGSTLRGVGASVLQNTIGGSSQTLSASGAPGAVSGATTGSSGIVLDTDGAGPLPTDRDPVITGNIQLERAHSQAVSALQPSASTNTDAYDFTYNQGFATGANLQVGFNNSRTTSTSYFADYSPQLYSNFRATLTQPLLQGAGTWVNRRFIYEAVLNRRITDSTFRQQILSTVNQVENIYWVVVSAYEDVQAKEHALDQSSKLEADTRKELDIGTMAPLDVVSAQSNVATDKQALISSQSNLNYQQLVLKQAIARNLNDPALVSAAIIPTDRVSLSELPEEKQTPDELTQEAFTNRPELEQAVLSLKKDAITLRGARNALLPTLNAFAFYGGSSYGGAQSPDCVNIFVTSGNPACPPGTVPTIGYGTVLQNMVNSTAPDKAMGFTLNIPLRNRTAQADQARSLVEYRQAELHLEQLYTQIRMQVVSQLYALTNDRAQVQAATAAQDYSNQSLESEQKKLSLGASTTANVLQQQRALAIAQNNLITARATYAKDRALLYQVLASTLQHYDINLNDAVTGDVKTAPVIPGLEPAKDMRVAPTAPPSTR